MMYPSMSESESSISDDIIKIKNIGRGRGGNNGWRSRGRGAASGRDPGFTRGGNSGGVRGRSRGLRVLSTRFGIRGSQRGQFYGTQQGRRSGRGERGGGRGGRGGGRAGYPTSLGNRIGIAPSFGSGRGRGREGNGRGGRGGLSRRQLENDDDYQDNQLAGRGTGMRQQLARRKLMQARRTLVATQQSRRSQARFDAIDARRGINGGVKTKNNLGTPLRVRMSNGTIVRGLRSDQLLLQKKRREESKPEKLERIRDKRSRGHQGRDSSRGEGSVVSLSSQRGLTVSIRNNVSSYSSQSGGGSSRSKQRISRSRLNHTTSDCFSPATFTVVNDRVQPLDEPAYQISPEPPRKTTKRNIITSRDPRARLAAISIPSDSVRYVPEPHRQILDPKVQKEIAMLQGKEEVTLNSGPGPGIKGFRHIPSQTSRSLNERFTEERMVTI